MKILLATDGSAFSRTAIDTCCDLIAGVENPSVLVVSIHEIQVPIAAEPFAMSGEYYQKLDEIAKAQADAAAEEAVDIILKRFAGHPVDITKRVEFGRAAEMIIEAAKEWNADLVIVGTHGRGFWGRLTLGSVSDAVVHHSPCSVLVVRNSPGA